MQNCRTADTPMTTKKLMRAPDEYEAPRELRKKYQSAVGSLMYLMLGTRPDLAYAVSVVSRYSASPTVCHWTAAKRIFRYLKGTRHFKLQYKGPIRPLAGYTDADWGGDLDTRRSTSGYCFNVGSGVVSWSSKRQDAVSLSTCEAEYRGQTQAAKEAIWLKRLFTELSKDLGEDGHAVFGPTAVIIYSDNQSAIALAKNPTNHGRTKHIELQQHFIREQVTANAIRLEYVPADLMVADGLTKPLRRDAFARFSKALGLVGEFRKMSGRNSLSDSEEDEST